MHAQNGVYPARRGAWTRPADANAPRAFFSLTPAQFRLYGRVRRGLRAPVDRYQNASARALHRKGCFVAVGGLWAVTPLGEQAFAAKGKLLPSRLRDTDRQA